MATDTATFEKTTTTPDVDNVDAPDSGPAEPTADEVAERVFAATVAGYEALSVYVGDRLGWYSALKDRGPATASELAGLTATHERYAREWLEQQSVMGILRLDGYSSSGQQRFALPSGAAEALTDTDSLAYLAPLPRMLAASGSQLPEILDAYRHGDGVSWEEFGADARDSQADINKPWFLHALPDALRGVEEVDAVLRRPGARILDVGCGGGWSTIALATAYPSAEVLGVDVDPASVEMARSNAASSGLGDRVQFRLADAASLTAGGYDAAFAFECVHDMSRPVDVLAAVRRAVRDDGLVIVMDERVADELTAPGDEIERWMYGVSLFICLPDGMSSTPSAGTGTVMRRSTLQRYAQEAGFSGLDVLPIEDFSFFRFYSLQR